VRGAERRLGELEGVYGRGPCEGCGDGGGGPASWEVVWVDPEEDSGPKWCGTCCRPLELVVTWADIPKDAGERVRWAERGK